MGRENMPSNTATVKQCQVVSVTFIATEWFFQHKKISKDFSTLAGGSWRLGEAQPLKISSADRSFNLSGLPKNRTINGPCHL